jgi:saccharopine dehydrogenase-like NADP-dependent oxidoreductase
MRVIVIGCGLQGYEIARDLAKDTDVGVCDIDQAKLNRCKRSGISKLYKVDINHKSKLAAMVKPYDVVVGAVPGKYGFNLVKNIIKTGKNMVDISFMPENAFLLNNLAKKHEVKVVVDCGFAPGLSNLLIGHSIATMKNIREINIAVGGLPQKPKLPLNYRTVFSLEDVLEEYTRKVKMIENGRIKIVEPLTELETITFKGIGKLECFNTDGLRSLAHTIEGVKRMTEKTIRYPGHTAQIKTLIECGLMETNPVNYRGAKINPRDFLLSILKEKLALGKDKDVSVFRVVVKAKKTVTYELVDYFRDGVTSMARTTGYPCAIVARLVGRINKTGVIPLEELGKDNNLFQIIMKELKKRNIVINKRIS